MPARNPRGSARTRRISKDLWAPSVDNMVSFKLRVSNLKMNRGRYPRVNLQSPYVPIWPRTLSLVSWCTHVNTQQTALMHTHHKDTYTYTLTQIKRYGKCKEECVATRKILKVWLNLTFSCHGTSLTIQVHAFLSLGFQTHTWLLVNDHEICDPSTTTYSSLMYLRITLLDKDPTCLCLKGQWPRSLLWIDLTKMWKRPLRGSGYQLPLVSTILRLQGNCPTDKIFCPQCPPFPPCKTASLCASCPQSPFQVSCTCSHWRTICFWRWPSSFSMLAPSTLVQQSLSWYLDFHALDKLSGWEAIDLGSVLWLAKLKGTGS